MHRSEWFESGKSPHTFPARPCARSQLCWSPLNAFCGVLVCMRIERSHDSVCISHMLLWIRLCGKKGGCIVSSHVRREGQTKR